MDSRLGVTKQDTRGGESHPRAQPGLERQRPEVEGHMARMGKLRHGESRQQGFWVPSLLSVDISLPVSTWIHPIDASWWGWRSGRSRRGVGCIFLSQSKPSWICPHPRAQQSSGGAGKQLREMIHTQFTPCCWRRGATRRVALPTCRHSSALLPLMTLRAEGLTAAILFPATLQMIQHNKTYNSPLEKRKL